MTDSYKPLTETQYTNMLSNTDILRGNDGVQEWEQPLIPVVQTANVRSAVEGLREDMCLYSYCCGLESNGKKSYCENCDLLKKWFPVFAKEGED